MPKVNIGSRIIGDGEPTYLVADIAANHDGDLERAKMLIHLAADAGADAVKFQHFRAPRIVSARGFEALGSQISHQEKWMKPVYEVYADASLPWEWTAALKSECDRLKLDFFSAPYDLETVDRLDPYVLMFKIGSGDITWPEIILAIAKKAKPVFLATGASDILDVQRAVGIILSVNSQLVLMQCNTNYTADRENFKHINLNVLRAYQVMFPSAVLGLSDHTPGHATVLGAVALGARVIEKHFTDDTGREGPDHPFSMAPGPWKEMVERIRELEAALGTASKSVCENEKETVVVQRRCLRASRDLKANAVLTREMIDALRPAPEDAISPYELERILGMRLRMDVPAGEAFRWTMLESCD